MNLAAAFASALWGALVFWAKVTVIVVLLVGLLQWLRDEGFVERWAARGQAAARALRLSAESVFPLSVGVAFGLTYGGAVLVQVGQEEKLTPHELWLVVAFLSICHAIFEDTAIFALLGAKWWVMVGTRLVLAFLLLAALAHLSRAKRPSDSSSP